MPADQSRPRPTPRVLRGKTDPARKVRPVDWTATGARRDGETDAGADAAARVNGAPKAEAPGAALPRRRRRASTVQLPRPAAPPPHDAVHSLNPEDERPADRSLTIDEERIRTVGARAVNAEQIIHTVADPQEAWTADAGTSDHFLRAELVVQVHRADNAVIGVFSRQYALSVRPAAFEPAVDVALDAAGPSTRRGLGTRHPTTRRELLQRMEEAGFVITPGSTHGRVSHPDHPGLFVPLASTPSDVRFTRHAVAQIRRVFGIDLRR